MKIISVIDNISENKNLGAEHGLSLYIETREHKILFDLGADEMFLVNAAALNINVKAVDTVIISHGHNDHGGGLNAFLKENEKAKIYLSRAAFGDYFSLREGGAEYIGLDKSLRENPRLVFTDGFLRIDDELTLFSDVDIIDERFSFNDKLKKKVGGVLANDDFIHEQNLIVHSEGKAVLAAGCSHNGIVNIIRKFIGLAGFVPDAVIGGFHLSSGGKCENRVVLDALAEKLNALDTKYYTCHCTGIDAYAKLKKTMCEKLEYLAAGDEITL